MHGGFRADGTYQPPRELYRGPAIEAWSAALRARGGDLFAADASLLNGLRRPTIEQQGALLDAGVASYLWNQLTIVGKIEAQGRMLADMELPDLAPFIVEDISEMGIGHLTTGLLRAHGLDEGGEPDRGIGGHDQMWWAVRDLALGAGRFPDVDPPESISRPEARRFLPDLPLDVEMMISLMANLLIIEFRAELIFAETEAILEHPFFDDVRERATEAIEVVQRIRADEAIHVTSLRLYLGELEQLTFRTSAGDVAVTDRLGPYWAEIAQWATVEHPALLAEQQREVLAEHAAGVDGLWERLVELDRSAPPSSVASLS